MRSANPATAAAAAAAVLFITLFITTTTTVIIITVAVSINVGAYQQSRLSNSPPLLSVGDEKVIDLMETICTSIFIQEFHQILKKSCYDMQNI